MAWDKLEEELRRRSDISWTAKGIFCWLAPLVRKGRHPGTRIVAQECGIDRKTARRALEQLRKAGLLEWSAGSTGRSRRYLLTGTGGETGPVDRGRNGTGGETGPGAKRDRGRNGTGTGGETGPPPGGETGPVPGAKRDHIQITRPNQTEPDGRAREPARARACVRACAPSPARGPSLATVPHPSDEQRPCSPEEYVREMWSLESQRVLGKRPNLSFADQAKLQELERRGLREAPELAELRSVTPERAFCALVSEAIGRHADRRIEEQEAIRSGKRQAESGQFAWVPGFVVRRWDEYVGHLWRSAAEGET